MATFNIVAFNGETGEFRDGIMFPELLTNDWENEQMVGPPAVKRGIIVGAQRRPVKVEGNHVLVPANRGQVAWQGDSAPVMRTSNRGIVFAASGSVETIRTESGGTRFNIVAPAEGEQAAIVFVQTGLQGNGREQEAKVLEMLAKGERIYDHGAYALDGGSRGLVRKIRTALTHRGGILTRVNQLIEISPGGSVMVAGMLGENVVWRLSNEKGRLRKVDAGENPRATFAKLKAQGRTNTDDRRDEMPAEAA